MPEETIRIVDLVAAVAAADKEKALIAVQDLTSTYWVPFGIIQTILSRSMKSVRGVPKLLCDEKRQGQVCISKKFVAAMHCSLALMLDKIVSIR